MQGRTGKEAEEGGGLRECQGLASIDSVLGGRGKGEGKGVGRVAGGGRKGSREGVGGGRQGG